MKGDLSQYSFRASANFSGTLFQQGRAFSDQDGNAADAIGRHLRTLLGRDTIGPGVAAVPHEAGDALKILQASADGAQVTVRLNPGRVWIDGLHVYVPGPDPLDWTADYFGPPIASPAPTAAEIAAGIRDAVVLECWEEAFSAYQNPAELIEPALGGPDTTERVVVHHRLRLLRLLPGEDCGNLDRIVDELDVLGRLTVTPAPTAVIAGDCPVQAGGGFTGLEHYLFRIEIATPDGAGHARFKYSRFNGGLVGRGILDGATGEVVIHANDQMINLSQLSDFHLEVLAPGPGSDPGRWVVAMTADATLVGGNRLSLSNTTGAWPGGEAFFRLWDGLDLIQNFPTGLATPNTLAMGIRLAFDPETGDGGNYRPGDFWTFPARAAGVDFDPSVWPNDAPPQGIEYHRAPLGILNWNAGPVVTLAGPPAIHDCRSVFPPLTRIKGCCTWTVGDGMTSFGDFDTIQAAVNALPASGGEICVLPGTYHEHVVIGIDNVRIHGCGMRSRVIADTVDPVFRVTGRSGIRIEGLSVQADENGIGILVEPGDRGAVPERILLADLGLAAARHCAIKVLGARVVQVLRCIVIMADLPGPWHAIYLRCEDGLVEHNLIAVTPTLPADGVDGIPDPRAATINAGRGGIQLAGTCERVEVIDNRIEGGIGNGITLGSLVEIIEEEVIDNDPGWVINRGDPCDPCKPGSIIVWWSGGEQNGSSFQSAGALCEIRIERNRITGMGLAGIGVVGFFDLAGADEFVSVVGLDILGNRITGCLARELQPIPREMREFAAYGAVVLADVEDLRFHDNIVEDNGRDQTFPVCGLFVLHGEALDIHRNRILNTGAKLPPRVEAQPGHRGGIVIAYAVPGITPLRLEEGSRPRQDGRPAARIHDNVVSQPLGQALFLQALGPVSVRGNAFTTRGLILDPQDRSFWAAAVWILNLGLPTEFYLQFLLFSGMTADPIEPGHLPRGGDAFIPRPRAGLDDFGIGRYLASGNVAFNDNQVVTDLTETEVTFAVSSVLIASLDDVSVQDNQLDCDFYLDFLFTNLIAAGMTLRIKGNRLKETLFITLYSSIGLGLIFNNTSENQTTHCILSLSSPVNPPAGPHQEPHVHTNSPPIIERDNQELFHAGP